MIYCSPARGFQRSGAEQAGVAVTLETWIREERGSQDTGYPEGFRGILQSLQLKAGIMNRLGHNRVLLNPFQFINRQSSYHSTLHSLRYW
jgi:hypothetical protein